jgi:hypothetical protein
MTERTAPIDQEPKQAPITAIHEAISAVYDEAAGAGQKPPNVREISAPVQSRLREQGLKASARQIEELASDDRHKGRRRERGKTLASEKP